MLLIWMCALLVARSTVGAADRTEAARFDAQPNVTLHSDRALGRSVAVHGDLALFDAPNAGGKIQMYGFDREPTGTWELAFRLSRNGINGAARNSAAATDGRTHAFAYEFSTGQSQIIARHSEILVSHIDGVVASMALASGVLVAGLPSYDEERGRVLIYRYDPTFASWFFDELFDGASSEEFGASVALNEDGTVLAVGAPGYGPSIFPSAGKVRIYTKDQNDDWSLAQTVEPPGGVHDQPLMRFGAAVSLAASQLAVGAPLLDRHFQISGVDPLEDAGAVMIFGVNLVFAHEQSFFGSAEFEQLGHAVSMATSPGGSQLLAVGVPGAQHQFTEQGRISTFRRDAHSDNWYAADRLFASLPQAGDLLGTSVSTDGLRILAGAPGAPFFDAATNTFYPGAGAALLFEGDLIFADGFEGGHTGAWDQESP